MSPKVLARAPDLACSRTLKDWQVQNEVNAWILENIVQWRGALEAAVTGLFNDQEALFGLIAGGLMWPIDPVDTKPHMQDMITRMRKVLYASILPKVWGTSSKGRSSPLLQAGPS